MNISDFYLTCLPILYTLLHCRIILITMTCSSQIILICIETNNGYLPYALFNMLHHFMFLPILQRNLELFIYYRSHRTNSFYVTSNKKLKKNGTRFMFPLILFLDNSMISLKSYPILVQFSLFSNHLLSISQSYFKLCWIIQF